MNVQRYEAVKNPQKSWSENPSYLLIISGVLIGFGFPLAKFAAQANIAISIWVALYSLGASLALSVLLFLKGNLVLPDRHQLRFSLIAGPLTFAAPNVLVYLVVPKVGAGFSGIMFALSPVCTVIIARLFGMNKLGLLKSLGVTLGLFGAIGMSLSQGQLLQIGSASWIVLAMIIPVALASGNVYRSLDWPGNSSPELLAFWSHTIAFVIYGSYSVFVNFPGINSSFSSATYLLFTQLLLGAITVPVVFRLQRFGGPVMLSQIGYVAAAISIVIATIVLSESYPLSAWTSMMVIAVGIAITVVSNRTGVSTTHN